MNKVKIYILEDEIITQELLKQTLENLGLAVCGMATNALTALEEITALKPDLAILDIKVEGTETGIWLGNKLDIPFVFLTAFNDNETIKSAIKTQPAGYLVKPFNTRELYIAIELALSKIKNNAQLVVKEKDRNTIVAINDILYAKKEDQYITLYLRDTQKLIRATIADFLKQAGCSNFMQVHRSYLINTTHITSFNNKTINLGEFKVPVSKSFLKDVLQTISS